MEPLNQEIFCLEKSLEKIIPLLPHQGPIRDFVHQNTLQFLIDEPFHEAVARASAIFGAHQYMNFSYYRGRYADGIISRSGLEQSIEQHLSVEKGISKDLIWHALFNMTVLVDDRTLRFLLKRKPISSDQVYHLKSEIRQNLPGVHEGRSNVRSVLRKKIGRYPDHDVNQLLFRLVGSYLDQGVTLWPYLEKHSDFLSAIIHLVKNSSLPLAHFVNNRMLLQFLSLPVEQAIEELLGRLLASNGLYEAYLKESLLEHPGWSGMINVVAHQHGSLAKPRRISLNHVLLLKLMLEQQYIMKYCPDYTPITHREVREFEKQRSLKDTQDILSIAYFICDLPPHLPAPVGAQIKSLSLVNLQMLWQEALENSYYQSIAKKFLSRDHQRKSKSHYRFQAVFCIDDRECSFRRLLEQVCSDIETFGFPGYFGIDCYVRSHETDLLEKMCPPSVNPKNIIVEQILHEDNSKSGNALFTFASLMTRHEANSMLMGFISAYTLGHLSLFRLMMSFLHPWFFLRSRDLKETHPNTKLILSSTANRLQESGLYLGYTQEEMAERIYGTLRSMGLVENFAPLIFIIGHGSSSTNNPHFAAYDCGACSGRAGDINARAFASMANILEVRQLLARKGITIPNDTTFIGGFHDTCTDEVKWFDVDQLSQEKMLLLQEFKTHIKTVQGKNALERCQKFSIVPKDISDEHALLEVHHRSRALFEPRPELGHATNALCIIGRRERTFDLNFERRAFLQSYDPLADLDGEILYSLMKAIIPVCGGINLEYFFSRVDPAIYGCGTKLSHNVSSLLGVGNGLDDDLRTGLPIQMTELHDPIRLLMIIEQSQDVIWKALSKDKTLLHWIENEWVKIARLDPIDDHLTLLNMKQGSIEQVQIG